MAEKEKERVIRVCGIDCADCAVQVERAVSKVEGVKSARLNLGSSTLHIETEGVDMEAVVKEVKKLGYEVEKEEAEEKITLYIEGLDCADEADVVEKKMKSLQGVLNYHINLVNQRINVVYAPAVTSSQQIIRAIVETGLRARLEEVKRKTKPWWQELRAILLFASGVLTLGGFILSLLGLPELASRVLYGLAVVVGGYYPARMGFASLRALKLNLYTLLVVAAIGAIALGLWEEAALLVFVYSLGSVLESYAVGRARDSIKALMALVPKEALVRRNGEETILPVGQVKIGDTIVVRPGDKIPLDGVVISGSTHVDQSPVTGESMPVSKKAGDEVFAATMNQRGSLEVRVTRLSTDTALARAIHSVEDAEARKSSYQRFAETFSRYYTPATFGVAFLTAVVPAAVGQPFAEWFYRSLVVLVVSCSCGLALSVPVSVVASISNAARKGVLIKGGSHLENIAGLKTFVFDKTGTLTIGRPQVTDVLPVDSSPPAELLSLAAAVESRSEHPLADAIIRKAREDGLTLPQSSDFEAVTGQGAKARVNGSQLYIGRVSLFKRLKVSLKTVESDLERLEDEGKTVVIVGNEKEALGLIAIADRLRPEAAQAIADLRKTGVKHIVMLTGDNEGTAKAIAREAGIDEYRAQLLPQQKVDAVKELKLKYGKVAMVGDGVNDAPAMAMADVGIAMGAAGTDVAMETSDVALMSDDLSKLPYAVSLSRRAVTNMKQNIAAAVVIVAFLIPSALVGFVDLVPGLIINEASMLIVIANGLRLLR